MNKQYLRFDTKGCVKQPPASHLIKPKPFLQWNCSTLH